jgi:hypothetical protein
MTWHHRSDRSRLCSRPLPLARALLLVLVPAAGCKGCKDDHPYVPYTIEDEQKAALADEAGTALVPSPGAGEDAGSAFHLRESIVAPPNASRWTLDGLDVNAPPDRVFVLGLTGDFDGDGAKDAVALVERADAAPSDAGGDAGTVDPGELVLYRGSGATLGSPQLIAVPPALRLGAPCTPRRRLSQAGKHTIAFETGAACEAANGAAGARYVAAIVVSAADARLHFHATLLDPPNAPALTVDIDGSDRDADGLDDIALRVSLEGGAPPFEPGPKVSALVRWFDRPAGMSRDPDEPDASLRALASVAQVRAARTKDAPSVPRYVEQVRSLYRALCVEGGAPRMVDLEGGRPLACGSASKGLEEAGLAEVRAYAATGDALRAIAALDRAQLPPATHTAPRTTDAQTWIANLATVLAAPSSLRALGAVPQIERGHAPSWGALAFDANGKVLIRTTAGVVRADPVQGDEASADDVKAWRAGVVSPEGAYRWVESYDACDGRSLRTTFAPNAGGDLKDVALPIAPPLGGKCASAGAHGELAATLPVAWGARGVEAIVAGEPLLISPDLTRATPSVASLGQPVTLGAPRSPNGKILSVPTSLGILVRGARSRLLRAKELEGGYLELRDCAVSDDGGRVACVRGGRAFVGVWDPE